MLPSELQTLRESLLHTKIEFADLLGRLRGVPVRWRTVEEWEFGRPGRERPIPIYRLEIDAIKRATTPVNPTCETCNDPAVVRKNETDLCGKCAMPLNWRKSKQIAVAS